MQLIDTHCHIDIERHFPDFEDVYQRARSRGVDGFVLAGVTRHGWERMLDVSEKYEGIYAAPGLHPMYLKHHREHDLLALEEVLKKRSIVALGEVGLDYHVADIDRREQQQLFEKQLDLAKKYNLPLLLHVRKAHDQVLSTLRKKQFEYRGIIHAYNGSLQQAEQYIKLGFLIGVGGTVTYERSKKIRRVLAELPSSTLVLETDSPDIPVASHSNERNLPEYLVDIVNSLAEVRSESAFKLACQTTGNARSLLGF